MSGEEAGSFRELQEMCSVVSPAELRGTGLTGARNARPGCYEGIRLSGGVGTRDRYLANRGPSPCRTCGWFLDTVAG